MICIRTRTCRNGNVALIYHAMDYISQSSLYKPLLKMFRFLQGVVQTYSFDEGIY